MKTAGKMFQALKTVSRNSRERERRKLRCVSAFKEAVRRIPIEKAELGGDGGSPQAMGNGFGLYTLVSEKPQKGVVNRV